MKCKNCGAELNDNYVCEYCGSKYNYISNNGDNAYYLEHCGSLYKVYLANIRNEMIEDVARNVDGHLYKRIRTIQHFEFVSY